MHTKMFRAVIAAIAVMVMAFSPVAAVTDGVRTGPGGYPYVGLMVAFEGQNPAWRCSGALVSPKIFITAGHCTYGADSVQLWFADDVEDHREEYNYPFRGETSGKPYWHPNYDPNAFYLYDLGVVVLHQPVFLDRYAELPGLNEVDGYSQGDVFAAVGYGLQQSFPTAAEKDQADLYRMYSHPEIIQINQGIVGTDSLLLSNNANTGGTCFGDSGGPNFTGTKSRVIGGVTSFGMNGTCSGTGGVYRIDRADDLNWLYETFGIS